jgi:hypothetical protein
MDAVLNFIKKNIFGFAIAIPVFVLFIFFTYKGNRICDCKETEKTQSGSSAYRGGGVNRFYHK